MADLRSAAVRPMATIVAAMALAQGCAEPEPPWYTKLQADSPCYRVDLADGLSEASTAEVQDLFWCLNHHGHLTAFEPAAEALETFSESGAPAGVELARFGNALVAAEVDPLELLQGALGLVDLPPEVATHGQDVALELIYGQTAIAVRMPGFDLRDPGALQRGVIAPLRPAIPSLAGALLDDPDTAALAGDLLQDPETHRWVRTVAAWAASTDPRVARPLDALLPEVGRAITSARSPANDRWVGASGDSLRDLTVTATRRRARGDLIEVVSPQIANMLADAKVRRDLPAELVKLQAQGHLGEALAQLTWLAEVDVDGRSLDRGEDSALYALIRLLYATNRPMQCRIDIWITVIDVDLGNLAVSLLRILADQDPDAVQSAAGLFGRLLGYGLGDGVLQSIAESRTCPALTPQVVRDLTSLDRLSEPSARSLTHTLIGLLRTLRYGDRDHVPDVVSLLSEAWLHGMMPPLEELLRDAGESRAVTHLTALVPVMHRPESYGVTAGQDRAATLSDLLELSAWLVKPDGGRTGWQRIRPLVVPATAHDQTFDAIHRLGAVMGDRNSGLSRAHALIPPLVQADPDLRLLSQLGPVLGDRRIAEPALRLIRTEPVLDAALATAPADGYDEVPLAFGARLIRGGTIDALFRIVRVIVDDLRALPR
jgi:hypothetical protein